MSESNPLQQFYRTIKEYVPLPSRGYYYEGKDIVTLTDDGEVGVMAMTGHDEMLLKNPDALLSGEAVINIIKSCVPAVKNPRKLLACDVDAIMLGIRAASYGDEAEMDVSCPSCGHKNHYGLNLDMMISNSEKLEAEYETVLPNGLSIFVVPSNFDLTIKQQKAVFEGNKIQKLLRSDQITDDQRLSLLTSVFGTLTKINYEMVLDSVAKITFTNEAGDVQAVTNKKHIGEFIRNITKAESDQIEELIAKVNSHGVKRTIDATCTECGHKWSFNIELNETNFS